jgi:hypothetical protein
VAEDKPVIISVINHTNGNLSDGEVQAALRAVNRQIAEDFAPHWGRGATLRLEGSALVGFSEATSERQAIIDMRGDAIIYLWDPPDIQSAFGFHSRNFQGIPYGFVYPEISSRLTEDWPVSLSHEALEMIVDPEINLMAMGPHPTGRDRLVFHWYEVCDAVQTEVYWIDGCPVSNFLLPLYFTISEEPGSRNDFLNEAYGGRTLPSFGLNPGGYVGFFDPVAGTHETAFMPGDSISHGRWEIKQGLAMTRRGQRYRARGPNIRAQGSPLRSFLPGGIV